MRKKEAEGVNDWCVTPQGQGRTWLAKLAPVYVPVSCSRGASKLLVAWQVDATQASMEQLAGNARLGGGGQRLVLTNPIRPRQQVPQEFQGRNTPSRDCIQLPEK